jgi:hypothetical protein
MRRALCRRQIISMGEASTGKSCLIKRYCEEKFVAKYISTIGVDFGGGCRCSRQPDCRPLLQCAQRLHTHTFRALCSHASRRLPHSQISSGRQPPSKSQLLGFGGRC